MIFGPPDKDIGTRLLKIKKQEMCRHVHKSHSELVLTLVSVGSPI